MVGEVLVTSSKGSLILGRFAQTSYFEGYAALFEEFEQAANDQLLVEIDRLEGEIAKLEFYVVGPWPQELRHEIEDIQIMKNGISFRLKR